MTRRKHGGTEFQARGDGRRDIRGYYPSGSRVMKPFRHPRGIIPRRQYKPWGEPDQGYRWLIRGAAAHPTAADAAAATAAATPLLYVATPYDAADKWRRKIAPRQRIPPATPYSRQPTSSSLTNPCNCLSPPRIEQPPYLATLSRLLSASGVAG